MCYWLRQPGTYLSLICTHIIRKYFLLCERECVKSLMIFGECKVSNIFLDRIQHNDSQIIEYFHLLHPDPPAAQRLACNKEYQILFNCPLLSKLSQSIFAKPALGKFLAVFMMVKYLFIAYWYRIYTNDWGTDCNKCGDIKVTSSSELIFSLTLQPSTPTIFQAQNRRRQVSTCLDKLQCISNPLEVGCKVYCPHGNKNKNATWGFIET